MLHNEKLRASYRPYSIRIAKCKTDVARIDETRSAYRILVRKPFGILSEIRDSQR
jgi:hypothetical protein